MVYPHAHRRPTAMSDELKAALKKWAVRALAALLAALMGALGNDQMAPTKTVTVEVPSAAPMGAELAPVDYEGCRFHGDHDDHAPQALAAQAARWPTDRITYSIDYASARGMNPPLSDAAIQQAARTAFGWWAEHLAIEFVEVSHGTPGTSIPCRFERIDGPAGVLAEAYLADGTNNPKPLRLDSSERWTVGPPATNQVSCPTVWCHEIGHSLGCPHDAQNAPAVMRPTYTASIPREQERDIARMVQLGYKRRPKVPPAPTDVLQIPVQLKVDDVVTGLKGLGFTVTKP
ncbi:MAG: matrixin family metalloprotease [Rhizobium sp.]|nr:MAG: matrixin family metalloprotease [Rhizobium sp.]